MAKRRCSKCGRAGHYKVTCNNKSKKKGGKKVSLAKKTSPCPYCKTKNLKSKGEGPLGAVHCKKCGQVYATKRIRLDLMNGYTLSRRSRDR